MPHLNIEYTAKLEAVADMGTLCAPLAATLVALQVDEGAPVYEGKHNNLAAHLTPA